MRAETSSSHREERVVTLLQLLGPEAAELVLECLNDETTLILRNRMKTATLSPPSVKKQQQVLEEFERFFHFTLTKRSPELKLHTEEGAEDSSQEEAASDEDYVLCGDPLIDLEKMNANQLTGALETEQPRTVALMLKTVTAKRIAQILNLLSESKREQVVGEMSRDPRAPDIILQRIARTIVERATTLSKEPRQNEDNIQRMVAVLRATEKSKRRQILKALEAQDPAQASQINQSLYQFEDLATLDDAQIQKVLARVDSTTLSTALFGADEKLIGKIMNNLSKRARTALQEELSFRRNVSGVQLQSSRQLLVQAIAESEQEAE